jgi:hypothetical protein
MKDLLINKSMRFFFFVSALIIWAGIYLTGFNTVHWLFYIPAVFFIFAAITGICPGLILSKMLFKDKSQS